ncbi:hypothetical protein ABTH28_18290, partial [Acinetobacter baumannii]
TRRRAPRARRAVDLPEPNPNPNFKKQKAPGAFRLPGLRWLWAGQGYALLKVAAKGEALRSARRELSARLAKQAKAKEPALAE